MITTVSPGKTGKTESAATTAKSRTYSHGEAMTTSTRWRTESMRAITSGSGEGRTDRG